jgi:hypothetical protein
MANNIVTGAQYNPFTFNEMLAAVSLADTAHKQVEDNLASLSEKASIWESLANNAQDADAYAQYKSYANDLENQIALLADQGLNTRSRTGLNKMRSRYMSDIAPIENAYTTRQKWIEEQRDYNAKTGGNARFTIDANQVGLGQLMRDPSMAYQSLSGAAIEKSMAEASSAFQNEIRDPNSAYAPILKGIFGTARYQRILQNGLSMQDVAEFQRSPQGNQILREIEGSVLNSYGYNDIQDEEIRNWMRSNTYRGAFSAVGKTDIREINNPDYDYLQQSALINQRAGAASSGRSGSNNESQALPYSVRNMVTVDPSIKTSKLNDQASALQEAKELVLTDQISALKSQGQNMTNLLPQYGFGKTNSQNATYSSNYTPGLAGWIGGEKGLNSSLNNKVQSALKTAGIDIDIKTANKDELLKAIDRAEKYFNDQIASSVIYDQMYSLDLTSNDGLATILQEQWGASGNMKKLPFELIEDGKVLSDKKTREFLEKSKFDFTVGEGNAHFRVGNGLKWSTVMNGKPVEIKLNPEVLNDIKDPNVSNLNGAIGDLGNLERAIEEASNNKSIINYPVTVFNPKTQSYETVLKQGYEAQALIDMFMTGLYNRGTRVQVQGNTAQGAVEIPQPDRLQIAYGE